MGLRHYIRVRRRISYLERLIAVSRHTRVAWGHELGYIRRTGRLDWVNPNPIRVHPASHCFTPPPAPRN